MNQNDTWPALPYQEWAPTRRTLHLVAQMLGKVRLALAPPQPEWLHACLYLDSRGVSTGAMPYGNLVVDAGIDVFQGTVWVRVSDGRDAAIPLLPDRSVSAIWRDLQATLADLGVTAELWDVPQEVADQTAFSADTAPATFETAHAQRFHAALCAIDGVFEAFRSPFFGRSGVQFWWGSFDFCVILFTGRHVAAPNDRGYILRYDLDAEQMNAGFWPGHESSPEPMFFAYLVPRPPGCEVAPIQPSPASWAENMGEWMLPYEHVRASENPRATLLDFLRSVYQFALANGWDADAQRYAAPSPMRHGARHSRG